MKGVRYVCVVSIFINLWHPIENLVELKKDARLSFVVSKVPLPGAHVSELVHMETTDFACVLLWSTFLTIDEVLAYLLFVFVLIKKGLDVVSVGFVGRRLTLDETDEVRLEIRNWSIRHSWYFLETGR